MRSERLPKEVLYLEMLSRSWSTSLPNFMLVSGIAQFFKHFALSRFAITQILNEPTRVTTHSQTIIDHIYATMSDNMADISSPCIAL